MGIFTGMTTLESIEAYAGENGGYGSEAELSEEFDNHIAPMVLETYSKDDTVAFNEEFNNWSDGLCKDGVLHSEQYNQYCYVGKYSS